MHRHWRMYSTYLQYYGPLWVSRPWATAKRPSTTEYTAHAKQSSRTLSLRRAVLESTRYFIAANGTTSNTSTSSLYRIATRHQDPQRPRPLRHCHHPCHSHCTINQLVIHTATPAHDTQFALAAFDHGLTIISSLVDPSYLHRLFAPNATFDYCEHI